MKAALEIRNISKSFLIRHEQKPYLSLRDSFVSVLQKSKTEKENFFALNDVSFQVFPGDTVGIIGKNGAGKSTLLKIISRITPPDSGSIKVRGRIASLLEVGTGFHPELTGRENIFFNGSILGMKRKEIEKNFDAIVDFSGVEKFLDTPLKHYSSGMQLRLAFAVAAFLENDILIIDEVLAVGDAEFQKKCIGKMNEVSKSGRTVLFVSHHLPSLQALCSKGIVLEKGKVAFEGSSADSIDYYIGSRDNHLQYTCHTPKQHLDFFVKSLSIETGTKDAAKIDFSESVTIKASIFCKQFVENVHFGFAIRSAQDSRLIADYRKLEKSDFRNNELQLEITLPGNLFHPRVYFLSTGLVIPNGIQFEILEDICSFHIEDVHGKILHANGIDFGSVITPLNWKML
jgi:lipopolysaccharide transport system ATP-binding protein